MEADLGLTQTVKYYEVADFVTANVDLWPFPTVHAMNQAKFDAESADQQQIITDAAANIGGFSIDFFEAPSELVTTLCGEGLKFAIASDADVTAFGGVSERVIRELSKDEQTAGFITQIQELKDGLGDPPAPAPLPDGCAVTPK